MQRNVAGQKLTVRAYFAATGLPANGEAANITMYLAKDDGVVTALADTSAAEPSATHAAGNYLFDLTQAETDAAKHDFTGVCTTGGVVVVAQTVYTVPAGFSTGVVGGGDAVQPGYALGFGKATRPLLFFLGAANTGLTPTVAVRKNGGGFSSPVGAVFEVSFGWYVVAGDAADTDTLGPLILRATAAGGIDRSVIYDVQFHDPDVEGLGTGGGARTVTVTVNDGSSVLEGARVRVVKGSENYVTSTDVSGVAVFNLGDGTWAVSVSLAGYTFAGASLVVNGTETVTYSMAAVTVTPSPPGQTTGHLTCYDEDGVAEAGVTVSAQIKGAGASPAGLAYDSTARTTASDGAGLVQFTGMFAGVTYELRRGTSAKRYLVTVPASPGGTYALPAIVGAP